MFRAFLFFAPIRPARFIQSGLFCFPAYSRHFEPSRSWVRNPSSPFSSLAVCHPERSEGSAFILLCLECHPEPSPGGRTAEFCGRLGFAVLTAQNDEGALPFAVFAKGGAFLFLFFSSSSPVSSPLNSICPS